MATTNQVSILVSAVDEASKVFNKITGSVNDFAKKNEETFKNMRNYGAVAFGSIRGYAGIASKAFAESQQQMARVWATLKNIDYSKVGGWLEEATKKAEEFWKMMQKSVWLSWEQGAESFSKLLQVTEDYTLATKAATLANDLAIAKGIDNSTATKVMALAMQGNVRALKEFWIEVEEWASKSEILGLIMEKVGGQWDEFAKTLAGRTLIMREAFGDLQESVGEALTPALEKLLAIVAPVIEKFTAWATENPELLKNIILIGGAITGFVTALGTLGLAIPAITAGLALISAPVVAIIAWIVALYFAWKNNFLGIQDITFAVLEKIKELWKLHSDVIFQQIKNVFDAIKQFWATWGDTIIQGFVFVWDTIKTWVTTVFGWLKEFWAVWWEDILLWFSNMWEVITILFNTAIELLTIAFVEGWNILKGTFDIFKGLFTGDWALMWEGIKTVLTAVWNAMKNIISVLGTAIRDYIKTVFWVDIQQVFSDIWNGIKATAESVFTGISNYISEKVEWIMAQLKRAKDMLLEIATLWNANTSTYNGARAVGGFTSPNTPYLVGERWPEIFMPTGSGRIIPNNELGGGGGVTINISGVTISNGMELNDLTDKIKSVIYNEHKYARLWY